jgi:hypothetical protein
LKDLATSIVTDALRRARVPADSLLLGAFLVLFGIAASVALPQISGVIRTTVADATKHGPTERAQRPTVRLHYIGVRVAQPKVPGGHDFISTTTTSVAIVSVNDRVFAWPADLAAHAQERGFRARAPPHHG